MRLSTDEVTRRLPAISLIGDPEVREETVQLSADAPAYLWTVPASTSDYHHPICRGERGLWTHTLMVSTVVERLAESWVAQDRLSWWDVDDVRAAAILHDQRKNGTVAGGRSTSSVSDHDLLMGQIIRDDSALPEQVAAVVDSHMGPWYDGPEPETSPERLLHIADMVASTATISTGLPAPIPEELRDLADDHSLPVEDL